MGISPNDGERVLVEDIRRTYAEAERSVIEKIAKYVKGGKQAPNWYNRKLAELDNLSAEVRDDIIRGTLQGQTEEIPDAVREAYRKGQKSAVRDLEQAGKKVGIKGNLSRTDREAVKSLSRSLTKKLNDAHFRILREAQDKYREVIGQASRVAVTGSETRLEAAQRAMNEFANRGVVGFTDSTGRNWNLSSYTEMATRSSTGRAAIDGHINRLSDNDHDLAMIGESYEECPLCRPWEGRVVSISGESDQYPALDTAISGGLFHPNCTHNLSAYIHGITETETADANPEAYQNRQQQRYNERQIRKWKRRKSGAMTEEELQKADSKIKDWQEKQRNFLEKTDRRRKYGREQIDQAR